MKSAIKFASSLIIFYLIAGTISAQDKIIKTNKDSINCLVKEIGDLEIKYTTPEVSETILFGIDKADVAKIILANGKVIEFNLPLTDPEQYSNNRKNALKVNFLSPLFNSFNINYERSIRPGRSFEGTLGLIGVGNDLYDRNEQGIFLKLGYKFLKSPDYYLRGQRYAHILKGGYIRPELAMSFYEYDYKTTNLLSEPEFVSRETNTMFALLLNFGKQWVIDNGFVIDTFMGVGYGFGTDTQQYGLHKAFIGGVDEFPIAFTMGIRVGWCF